MFIGAYLGSVAVLLFVAILVAVFLGKKGWLTYLLLFALYFASTTSFYLMMAFGRLQIRENGIWQYIGLVQWDRIESYDWQGEEEPKLMLEIRRRLFRQNPLSVPLEHTDAVDELLPKYVCIQQNDFKDTR